MMTKLETQKQRCDFYQSFMRKAHPGEWVSFEDLMRFADTSVYMSREGNDKYDTHNSKNHMHGYGLGLSGLWAEVAQGHFGYIAEIVYEQDYAAQQAHEILMAHEREDAAMNAEKSAEASKDEKNDNVNASIDYERYNFVEKVAHKVGRCVGNVCRLTFG